jgi:hypothetical protein
LLLILGGLFAHPTRIFIVVEQASTLLLILGRLFAHPTGIFIVVEQASTLLLILLSLDSHAGRKHFRHANNWQLMENFGCKSID